jgi:hypothetical protein
VLDQLAAPKAPAAGSTVSRVAANDAAQLAALMGVKAAIDKGGILKGEWTQSSGVAGAAEGSVTANACYCL